MGVASGCGCKEVYRFPHITYPNSSCIFSFLQQHPYFSEPCVVHIPILSPFLFRQSLYSLFLNQRIFYLLVSFHFYCPRLFVVV